MTAVSGTYGKIFLATFSITNNAASLLSHVAFGSCRIINICLKQLLEPTTNTTSLIMSDTFRRKSYKIRINISFFVPTLRAVSFFSHHKTVAFIEQSLVIGFHLRQTIQSGQQAFDIRSKVYGERIVVFLIQILAESIP